MIPDHFHPIVLNAGKAENVSDWNYSNVCSPFARIYFIAEGSASVRIGPELRKMTPGHLYLIPPFVCHDEISDGPFTHYYIHIYEDRSFDNRYFSLFEQFALPFGVSALDTDAAMIERLVELNPGKRLAEYDPQSYSDRRSILQNISSDRSRNISISMENRAVVLFLLSRFLLYSTPRVSKKDKRIEQAMQYVGENLSDPSLSVEAMSRVACLSVNQFIRRFKAETGITPLQYLTDKRIENARILLLNRALGIKQVAIASGYDDPAYFCKVFRKILGIPPQQYRETILGNIDH